MSNNAHDALAWVESPLQVLTAAEWAHRHRAATGGSTAIAYRISDPQTVRTIEALHRMRAPFSRFEPYVGIPWARLAGSRQWVIGDPFSGQFRAAAAVLPPPRRITFVDDGAMVVHAMRALAGEVDYARAGQHESRTKVLLGGLSAERIRRLAQAGRAELFTAFGAAAEPAKRVGIRVSADDFSWMRQAARGDDAPRVALPHPRIVLGTARVVDGLLRPERHRSWVGSLADLGPLTYLPHRRESAELVNAVASLPGVTVVRADLPVELVLAAADDALELHTLPSSAVTTLRLVLDGTGSTIHAGRLPSAERAPGGSR